ncbi:MAG: tetratricopeptide repeat protein [Fimbriiglobus sp.]|jgi:predicted Zn-dependent protease|nr:tetratricopeptide repeat protein [Fimbriiglobus sp.]
MSRTARHGHPRRVLKTRRLMIVLAVVLGAAGLGTAAYWVQNGRQAPQWLEMARTATNERSFSQAVECYDRYLAYRPKDAAAVRFELAEVYDDYARESIARPGDARRLWEKALTTYHLGLADDPERPEQRRKLAKLYLLLNRAEPARKEIELIRKRAEFRDDPELYEMLAACDDGPGKPAKEKVAEHLRAAVKTGKAGVDVYLQLALLLKRDLASPKAQEEAEILMQKLVQDKPADLPARLARARYHAEFGKRQQAREDIKFAYENIPGGRDNVDVVLAHADAVAADSLDDARRILARGVEAHPNHPYLGMGLAEVDQRAGQPEKARERLAAVFAKLPDGDPLALEVGDRLLDLGGADTAAKAADRLDANPQVAPLATYLRGRVKLAQGDWPTALPLLRQAVVAIDANKTVKRKLPMLHKAYMALGAAYGLANDPERQADAYYRAATADQTSVAARVAWADALAKLGRTADAAKAYADVAPSSPAARVAMANLKLAEDLATPSTGGRRQMLSFRAHVGDGPYPPELVPLVATALTAEGKTDEAKKLLVTATEGANPAPAAFALLAALEGGKDPAAGLAVLDRAEQKLGPTVDTRLARASLLARQPKPDLDAVAALATADSLPAADRARLQTAIGELLLSLGAGEQGVKVLLAVAGDRRHDLNVRLTLFDWALLKKDAALRDRMLAEIRTLDADRPAESGGGGIALVAEVMNELADNPRPTPGDVERMAGKLSAAEQRRKGWSRIPRMQGILAGLAERPEEAVRYYEQAVTLGDRSEPLVRELVRLHFRKERYADARRVLEAARRSGDLSPELEQQYQVLLTVAGGNPSQTIERAISPRMRESTSYQDHVLRAQVLARLGREADARQALDTALKLAPASPDVLVVKVRVLLMLGVPADQLRPEIEAAAAILKKGNPNNPAAAPLALGQMWEAVGDTAAAVTQYTAAMTAAPADRDAPALLLAVYRRTNNSTAADALLSRLATGPDRDLRLWAKRQQAAALTAGPDGLRNVPLAVKLLDENIAEADRPEDHRARAFARCADPRERKAGLEELKKTRDREPLPAADTFRLANILVEGAELAEAERELSVATAGGLLADPSHLVLLAQVQTTRGDLTAATRSLDRLKVIAPKRPDVLLAEARLLAKSDQAKAAQLVRTIPSTGLPLQTAGWLETIGCVNDAAKEYEEYYARGSAPPAERLTAFAGFLARSGRGDRALALLQAEADKLKPEEAAALMVAAVLGRPEATVPAAQKAEWAKAVDRVVKFVEEKGGAKPAGQWLLWQAELADARGDLAKAIRLYDTARGQFPAGTRERAVAQNNWVVLRVLDTREGTDERLREINEVIAEVGPQPFALDTRGLVFFWMGKPSEAATDFEAAAAFAASPANLFHLAQCYRKLNRDADAAAALDRAKLLGLKKESLHPREARDYDAVVR